MEEILNKLEKAPAVGDFDGAIAIYSSGGDSKAIIAATLESLATPGATTMASDTWYPVYKTYWDSQVNYADKFVQDAASGTLPDAMKKELIKKGIVYQGVWMYAVHNLEKGKRDCDVDFWDEGMAYYIGSLEGEYATSADYASTGNLLYALAQKRCSEFGTCATPTDRTTLAAVNDKIQSAAIDGSENYLYHQVACDDAGLELAFKGMVSQMTVPLVQGLLKYAWKADPANEDSCASQAGNNAVTVATNDASTGTDCAKSWAEGWAFAAAVLPRVHQCDVPAATTIKDNLDIEAAEPMKDGVAAVKTAIESVYDCLGISCTDVGAYQSSGVVYAGMDACTFAPSYDDLDSTERSGGTVPWGTDEAGSDDKKSNNSLVVILCAVGGAVLVVGLVILAINMLRKPAKRSPAPPVHEPTNLAPIKAETHEMMEAQPPLRPMPQEDPYGYEGAGGFAAEEEEVAPAEAVLAAEPSPPAQSWAPELEQELEPEC